MARQKPIAQEARAKDSEGAEKMLSVRIPEDRHTTFKLACVAQGVSIRSVLMALIDEVEADSEISRALLQAAALPEA